MRVILKPMGVVIVLGAIAGLSALAFIPRWTNPGAAGEPAKGEASGNFTWSSQSAASPSPVASSAASPAATPTSGSTSGASSPAASAGTVFSDSAVNGWQTEGWTWAKDTDFKQTKVVHSGTSAIRVRYTNYDGVKFHHEPALDTHPYNRLSFYVYGEEGGQTLQVIAQPGGKSTATGVMFTLPANKWIAVSIPLETLGIKDRTDLTDFFIQGMSEKTLPQVYIDDVRLLTPSDPTPDGESVETRSVPTSQK